MYVNRKKYSIVAVALLFILFPAVLVFSNYWTAGNNDLANKSPVAQEKLTNGASSIVVSNNNEFVGAGFTTGDGSIDNPYVLNATTYGNIITAGPPGINISNTDAYFLIENVTISGSTNNFVGGIMLENVTNGKIRNTTVTNSYRGFCLILSNHTILTGNNASGSTDYGFYLTASSNNTLTGNNANGSTNGFFIRYYSDNNTFIGNNATGNTNSGFSMDTTHYNTLIGNNASGNAVGFNLWGSSTNNTLTGNTAMGNTQHGIFLHTSSNYNNLTRNNATGNINGFYLYFSSNFNTLTGNIANGNTQEGFYLYDHSSNNTFTGNTANGNGNGFYLETSSSNNTLTGNNATGNSNGFYLYDSSEFNTLTGNNANGNTQEGFYLDTSCNLNILIRNNATGNENGFYLFESSNNTLTGNIAKGNDNGFFLHEYSNNNTMTRNNASGNTNGFYLDFSSNNTMTRNNASGNTQKGFYLYEAYNSTLTGNNANGNEFGFYLYYSSNNTLTGNNANENTNGFYLYEADNNTLIGNIANNNTGSTSGFYLYLSHNNTLTANIANGNNVHGFDIRSSNDSTLTGNTANGNDYGFYLWLNSGHNNLTGNYVSNNTHGFVMDGDYNFLTWNTVYNNTGYGIELYGDNNTIYFNFFIDNSNAPQAMDQGLDNSWNGSTHGNYWSDYSGIDGNGDGIGETNYTLAGISLANDTLPLVAGFLSDLSTLQLTGPDDLTFEAGSTKNLSLTWHPITNIPVNTTHKLYLDDTLKDFGNWTSGIALTLAVNLTDKFPGDYNITLLISDYSNKTTANTVWVTVEDTNDPVIDYAGSTNFTVEAGYTGTLSFTLTDLFPIIYTLYLDDTVNRTDNWDSGNVVTASLDGLTLGTHNFTLSVKDMSGNEGILTVLVTVEDTVDPIITYTGQSTITFEAGSTGNTFTISATDLYPSMYTLYQNGTEIVTDDWTNGTTVIVDLDGLSLPAGTYNITLVVMDTSGNMDSVMATVTVTTTTTTTTIPTSSSSITTTTTTTTSAPGWTAPLVLLSLAGTAAILSQRRSRREK